MTQTTQASLRFLTYHIPGNVDLLYQGRETVPLEKRAVQVLRYLAARHERVVTKDELLEAVWPDTFTTDGVLKRAISQIRRALGDDAEQARFIETYHGRGYRFIAPVSTEDQKSEAPKNQEAVKAQEAAGVAATTAPQAEATAPAAALVPDYNQLVGRDAELEMLRAEYQRTLEGAGRPVLILGEPGMGKTQLAREFRRWARERGARCLYARFCDYRASRLAPYEVFLDLLKLVCAADAAQTKPGEADLRDAALARFGVTLPEELFAGAFAAAATALPRGATGPLMLRRASGGMPAEFDAAQAESYRAVVPISQCFLGASRERPLVIVLDDLQWADEASYDVIGYLMRTLQSEPLMIVALARSDAAADPDHPLAQWLRRQANHRCYTGLTLKPLGEGDTRRVIEAVFGGPESCPSIPAPDLHTLHEVTGGNPYFLAEMLRLLAAEGAVGRGEAGGAWQWRGLTNLRLPDTIVLAMQSKLDHLSADVREMAEQAAVLGDEFRVDVLARLMERDEGEVERLMGEAVRRGVLSERGLTAGYDCRFYHTTLRRVLYESIPPRRRKRLHARAAESLAAIHAREVGRFAASVAAHYDAAGEARETFKWSLQAWLAASSRWHWSEAMSCIERARRAAEEIGDLPTAERLKLCLNLGESCYAVGRLKESDAAYGEAITLARSLKDQGALALAHLQQGQTRIGLSLCREAAVSTERALEIHRGLGDAEGAALALIQLGNIEVKQGNYEAAAKLIEQALEGVPLNSPVAAVAFGTLGWARALQGCYAEGVPLLERAVGYLGEVGDVQRRAVLLRRRHWAELSRGQYESAITLAGQARDDFRSIGDARGEAKMTLGVGQARIAQGLYEEGVELLRQALDSFQVIGETHMEAESLWLIGRAYVETCRGEEAGPLLARALELVREVGDRDDEFRILTDIARLKICAGLHAGALEAADEAVAIAESLGNRDGLGAALVERARACVGLKEYGRALEAADRAITLLDEAESGECWRARWARAQARLAASGNDQKRAGEAVLDDLRRAVAQLEAMRSQLSPEDEMRRRNVTAARSGPARDLHTVLSRLKLQGEAVPLSQSWDLN
jgi:DNA-binding winged helix-turn-helix (wHTH) protein